MNISKLALAFTLSQAGPATTLLGTITVEMLLKNLDVFLNGITEEEKEVLSYVKEK